MTMRRYPGITPFRSEDAPVFKGRSVETREVTNLILSQKTLILFAKSGIGKTSLLNAGVVPGLKRYGLYPIYIRFNQIGSGDSQNPVDRFKEKYQKEYEAFNANRSTPEDFRPQPTLWKTMCQNQLIARHRVLIPLLIFDQFEEFFRTYPKPEDRQEFLNQLAELLSDAIPHERPLLSQQATVGGEVQPLNLRIVLSIRSDMLNMMQEVSRYLPFVLRMRYELLPMMRPQATEAIQEPGLVADGPYETSQIIFPAPIIDNILTNLENKYSGEVESFQLQLVCSKIEDKLIEENRLAKAKGEAARTTVTEDDYGGSKGIDKIVEDYFKTTVMDVIGHVYDAGKQEPTSTDRSAISKWWLVYWRRPGVVDALRGTLNSQGNRILREDSELRLAPGKADLDHGMKNAFVDRRILKREEIGSNTYYEISHDKIALALLKEKARIKQQEKEDTYLMLLALAALLILGLIGVTALKNTKPIVTYVYSPGSKNMTSVSDSTNLSTRTKLPGDATQGSSTTLVITYPESSTKPAVISPSVSVTTSSSRPNQSIPPPTVTMNYLFEDRLGKVRKAYEQATNLMRAQFFNQAINNLPTEKEFMVDFPTSGLAQVNPKILPEVKKLERLIRQARRSWVAMQPIQNVLIQAECLESSLRIACANELYKKALAMNQQKKASEYRYPDSLLVDKINATEDPVAEGVYAGLNNGKLKSQYSWLKINTLKEIYDKTNCNCTRSTQLYR